MGVTSDSNVTRLPHGARERTVPASRYFDPAYLAMERQRIFQRAWTAACPERWLAKKGDYTTVEDLGRPLIVLRDGKGAVRAYVNSCRHRGTRLLDGRGNVPAIRCPYHDWKYALDGRLRHVPGADGFEPFDKGELGLLPVRAATFAGFVWVTFDESAPPLEDTLGDLCAELEPYARHEMVPIQESATTLPCNWKAVLDNATESYHLPFVHGGSVDKYVDSRPEFTNYGDHYRLTLDIGADLPFRTRLDDATSRGGPYTRKQKTAIHKYVIFPNFLMNVLPYHFTVFQVTPIDADRCRFFYGFYKRRNARGLEWLRAYGTWLASKWIWLEDLRILERFQSGVRAAGSNVHRFHEQEEAIGHFHGALSRWMDAEP